MDSFAIKARREGYYARSAYKLKEINNKYKVIRKRDKVLDIGCSPGGWSKVASEVADSVLGIDVKKVKFRAKNFRFIQKDIKDVSLKEKFDVIISDIAPKTTGNREFDEEISVDLVKKVITKAKNNLKLEGNLVVKVYEGRYFKEILKNLNGKFIFAKPYRSKITKKRSREVYIICKNFRGF